MNKEEKEKILVSRGFIVGPSPEIYGGVGGFYSFGPMGKIVKNNIENIARKIFKKHGFYEVECPTIMPEIVWKASGHLDRFVDMMVICKKCGAKFKEEVGKKCPLCGGEFEKPVEYNLMMKTKVGTDKQMFLRPETATTTYLLFPRLFNFFRKKMPIKVFQIGKAYRNEISPRQGVLRLREFTQMEAQMFILPENEINFPEYEKIKKEMLPFLPSNSKKTINTSLEQALKNKYIKKPAFAWCLYVAYEIMKEIGLNIRFRQHKKDEMAHYADDAWDIEAKINNNWVELCGVHDRTNYDLKRHSEFSKKKIKVNGKIPNVLEIAFGVERMLYAVLINSLGEDKRGNLMRIPKKLSPYEAAVFPLLNNKEMEEIAKEVYEMLYPHFRVFYDSSGSIGRRYRRQDEIGTPYCITIDHQTIEDKTVTIRERDSMKQRRYKINELKDVLNKKLFDATWTKPYPL